MGRSSAMPRWLTVLLALVAIIFLGPPVLGLLAGVLGLAIGLTAVALKVGVVMLFVAVLLAMGRALFGSKAPAPLPPVPRVDTLATVEARLDEEEAQRRAALDRELEAAVRSAR